MVIYNCSEKLLGEETLTAVNTRKERAQDEVPDDIHAFYAATDILGGEDRGQHQASSLAMLHEYHNLPAIDKQENNAEELLR